MTDKTPPDDKLLTMEECAERLGISIPTLRRKVDELRIPHVRMGRQIIRFHFPTVFKYLNDLNSTP